MSHMKKGVAALGALTLASALLMSACGGGTSTQGSESSSGGDASGSYDVSSQSITFIPKQLNNPFSDVMLGGGKNAAGEIGFAEVNVVGPLEASSSSQVSFINSEVQAARTSS